MLHMLSTLTAKRRALALAAFLLSLPAALAEPARERWYVVSLGGVPAGSVREAVVTEDGGAVRSTTELRLVLQRLGSRIEMTTSAASRESPDGRLASAEVELTASAETTSMTAEVKDGEVLLTSRAGGRSFERSLPFSGELLGPEGLRRLSASRLAKPGDTASAQIFSPELGTVTTVTRTVRAATTVTNGGRQAPALEVEERVAGYPVPRTLWLDAEGRLVQSEEAGPFGAVRVARADEAAARLAEAGADLPQELYETTLLRTGVRLPKPREIAWLKLRLTRKEPGLGWPEGLARPGQTVSERTAEALTLEVARPEPPAGVPFPVAVTEATRPYLEPNAYVQSDDPAIRAAARQIVGDEKDLVRAAVRLQEWVARNMTFDTGIVLAPSTEVFRDRRGTCAGYAMLLTALARAAGIPARYVLGYVYVDGIFGGHAWTEVLAGDTWVPLDAAIVADGPADAARFAFQDTSLAEGPGALQAGPSIQMYGQIGADVLAWAPAAGPRREVPAGARPAEVRGDRWTSPGLGLALEKPAGFRFTDLDAVWPSDTVVGLVGPAGEKALLERADRRPWEEPEAAARQRLESVVPGGTPGRLEVDGRPALLVEGEGRAALAVPDGLDLWVLSVEAPRAAALLSRLAGTLEL